MTEVLLCDRCKEHPVTERDDFQELCEACLTEKEENQAEADYERQLESYYGGGEPFTMEEIHRAAWEQKQQLKGRR